MSTNLQWLKEKRRRRNRIFFTPTNCSQLVGGRFFCLDFLFFKMITTKAKMPNFNKKIYGMELILEIFGCDKKIITSPLKIKKFINSICKEIGMEKYGPSLIKRFGGGKLWGEGYSFFQFITTSSVAGHFIEPDRIAFINIFSCNKYNVEKAAAFAKRFFQAEAIKSKLIIH